MALTEIDSGLALVDDATLPEAVRGPVARIRAAFGVLRPWLDHPVPMATAASALPDLRGVRVFVVADDPRAGQAVQDMLAWMGAEVVLGQASETELAGPVDLAVAAVETSAPRGVALLLWLRHQLAPLGRVPILAVAPQALRQHEADLHGAGADAVVRSPVESLAALGGSVLRILHPDARQPAERGPQPGDRGPGDRLAELLAMAGPDGRAELLDQLEADLSRVAQGLTDATDSQTWTTLRADSHVLISLSGALGHAALLEMARHLNRAAHASDAEAATQLVSAAMPNIRALIARVAAEPRGPSGDE